MKIAVSASGKSIDSSVDPRFGRAPFFVIVDSETGGVVSVLDNRAAADAAHGAGINAASMVANAGVNAVLTGRVGPKAAAVLEKAGIRIISDASGTVSSAMAAQRGDSISNATSNACGMAGNMGQGLGRGAGRGGGQGRGCGCGGGGGNRRRQAG